MIRIESIKIPVEQQQDIKRKILQRLQIDDTKLINWRIARRSIDARRKNNICLVYTIDAEVKDEAVVLKKCSDRQVKPCPPEPVLKIERGLEKLDAPPVVIGAGPAGLFAGLLLAQNGYRPVLLERGKAVPERVEDVHAFWKTGHLNPDSNVQFGEGGAGTFSDGKLTTRISDPRCSMVLKTLAECGAPEDILYDNRPHIGTDRLRQVVMNLRRQIVSHGGQVRFRHHVESLVIEKNRLQGVRMEDESVVETTAVIGAMGHSARAFFQRLYDQGIEMAAKPFSIGLRVEHPQSLINTIQYGTAAREFPVLGAADYRLSWRHHQGKGAYSFCMCPGGQVVAAASEAGGVVTNGMSAYGRNGKNANSALLVSVTPDDFGSVHPLAGIQYQRKWEQLAFQLGEGTYRAPAQRLEDFLCGRPSNALGEIVPTYRPGVVLTDLAECLPQEVVAVLRNALKHWDRSMKGFALPDAVLTGVETRSSSPVRIVRNNQYESSLPHFYPAGEGAGYAGGIMSAAVDGLKAAEALMRRVSPP